MGRINVTSRIFVGALAPNNRIDVVCCMLLRLSGSQTRFLSLRGCVKLTGMPMFWEGSSQVEHVAASLRKGQ